MKANKLVLITAMATFLVGCGSTSEKEEATKLTTNLPQWVLNPNVEDGIAASDCVKFNGNFSVAKKMAVANGRLALAQQLETRIEGLDKTYSNRTDANDDSNVGATFSSVSKQLTKQVLSGSSLSKSDIVEIAGKQHFCGLTTLSPSATRELFDALVKQSKRSMSAKDEKFLYQEFKAHKAEQNLEQEIQRLTN